MSEIDLGEKLIVVRGPICAGKSTLATALRDRLLFSSYIDHDVFKLMIDNVRSTTWRQNLAFDTALGLIEELMHEGRTVIADIHSSKIYQYRELKDLAALHNYSFHSFLLMPPLQTCIERNRYKKEDAKYEVRPQKITEYWAQTFRVEEEPIFDSSELPVEKIVEEILNRVKVPAK